ncbi:cell division protein SepF [uncultured Acidaminococcus sp.]|uniref:cell division protein SepF n=1 Tax=uncultured Acidaminococcus sp. TaxID=352152 RepID=UPI002943D5BE|nr:cell division protein SepF [uncultured Acidaminococcus sp.]
MKKISKLLEYFGLVNGEDKQETDETMETQQQDEGKVVPMFGSGSTGTWRDKSSDREYDKYDRPYEKTYEKPYDKVFDKDYDSTADSAREETSSSRTGDKVLSMPVNRNPVSVVVIEPIDFNDSQKMADYLCKNQPVVINFEDTDADVRKRIIDFISGTIYALDGTLRKIGRNLLVCAPPNVDIDTENTNFGSEGSNDPWQR